jgi:hypothetical protein
MQPVSVKADRSCWRVRIALSVVIRTALAWVPSATAWISITSGVPRPTKSSACNLPSAPPILWRQSPPVSGARGPRREACFVKYDPHAATDLALPDAGYQRGVGYAVNPKRCCEGSHETLISGPSKVEANEPHPDLGRASDYAPDQDHDGSRAVSGRHPPQIVGVVGLKASTGRHHASKFDRLAAALLQPAAGTQSGSRIDLPARTRPASGDKTIRPSKSTAQMLRCFGQISRQRMAYTVLAGIQYYTHDREYYS